MSTEYEHAGWVISSQYRHQTLSYLAKAPGTPSRISSHHGYEIPHISRALGSLRERGLVELLVPEDQQKGRVYGITDNGEEVHEQVEALLEDPR